MKQGLFEKEIFIPSNVKTVIKVFADYSQRHGIYPLIVEAGR